MEQALKYSCFSIGTIPAILYGDDSDKVYLFLHGQGGNKEEAVDFARYACPMGWQVLSIDFPGHGTRTDTDSFVPWVILPELHQVMAYLKSKYTHTALYANSIGAWFGMLAFSSGCLKQALFVSPILDMEILIETMMQWANVSKEQLQKKRVISTDFGHTLSWEYLSWVHKHPITNWMTPTHILYGDQDNLTARGVVHDFITRFGGSLVVMENGEHWFHTPKQREILNQWILDSL